MRNRNATVQAMLAMGVGALFSSTAAVVAGDFDCSSDAMLVFDASGSMIGPLQSGKSKIQTATDATRQVLPAVTRDRKVGLLTFGPGKGDQCSNVTLHVEPRSNSSEAIQSAIDSTRVDGGTPLALAIETAADVLSRENRAGVIVVVTDGDETCGRNVCDAAQNLSRAILSMKVHVIGIGNMAHSVSCIADKTNGNFVETNNLHELTDALRNNLGCPELAAAGTKK